MLSIRMLGEAELATWLPALSALLIDAVDSGASVGFLAPLAESEARDYWLGLATSLGRELRLLGAFEDGMLVASVQLALAGKANARHRAEVQKLVVLRSHRGRGIAKALMAAVEALACQEGRRLLVLDTRLGDTAERLYGRIGYQRAGEIPDFARSSAGTLDATVLFYKRLTPLGETPA